VRGHTSIPKHGQDLFNTLYNLRTVVDHTITVEEEGIDGIEELLILLASL
jgi:hypothetical protein